MDGTDFLMALTYGQRDMEKTGTGSLQSFFNGAGQFLKSFVRFNGQIQQKASFLGIHDFCARNLKAAGEAAERLKAVQVESVMCFRPMKQGDVVIHGRVGGVSVTAAAERDFRDAEGVHNGMEQREPLRIKAGDQSMSHKRASLQTV